MKIKLIFIMAAAAVLLSGCGKAKEVDMPEVVHFSTEPQQGSTPATAVQPQSSAPSATESDTGIQPTSAATSEPQQVTNEPATALSDKKLLNFEVVSQYPELPTGCEVTSLAMVLNYYGLVCDKCEIADNYLNKGAVGTVDFHEAFEGDPRDGDSYGCYANVIVQSANRIIAEKGSALTVSDLTGTSFEELYTYIDSGVPVIVWGTQDCQPGHYSVTWTVDGKDLTWFTPEHCMVLVGYDNDSVYVADPIYGEIKEYDKDIFTLCYDSLYKQAIVIK